MVEMNRDDDRLQTLRHGSNKTVTRRSSHLKPAARASGRAKLMRNSIPIPAIALISALAV